MVKTFFVLLLSSLTVSFFISESFAATKFRVCSQNLERVGKLPFGRKKDSVKKQTSYLVERFLEAKCDVIAVQEVYGKTKNEALESLDDLKEALEEADDAKYISLVGESQFDEIRNGFLLNEASAKILYSGSTPDGALPKLNPLQRSRSATRRPFALLLDVASTKKDLLLVNIHLKSKVGGFKDSSGLDFETLRMESSEQTREFALELAKESKKNQDLVSVILGDRNSRPKSATDLILQGRLRLADFQAGCSVTSDLEPGCAPSKPVVFEPTFAPRTTRGSSKFRGQEELIDEIYLNASYLEQLRASRKNLEYGLTGEFFKGSDHKLVWVDLQL